MNNHGRDARCYVGPAHGRSRARQPAPVVSHPWRCGSPWTLGAGFQASGFRLQASDFRLQASDFRLQAPGFRLQTSGFRLQASGLGPQASGFGPWGLASDSSGLPCALTPEACSVRQAARDPAQKAQERIGNETKAAADADARPAVRSVGCRASPKETTPRESQGVSRSGRYRT